MCRTKDETTDAGKKDAHLRCVVKVECGPNQGTAVCVHSSNTVGLVFLTCAHVVQNSVQTVTLRHEGRVLKGKVIYATRKNVPHDIAVIVSRQAADIEPCRMSDKIPEIGQQVFAVGYTFEENEPTTVFGLVHMMSFSVLTTTCDVRMGFSGGPVFTSDRNLLGLTIGKFSVGTMNFVLPSSEFVNTIDKYIHTNNLEVLDNLESKCQWKKMIWNNGIPNLNLCHI